LLSIFVGGGPKPKYVENIGKEDNSMKVSTTCLGVRLHC
jgi:hypothetical protein